MYEVSIGRRRDPIDYLILEFWHVIRWCVQKKGVDLDLPIGEWLMVVCAGGKKNKK